MSHELPDPPDLTGQSKSPKMKFRDDIEIDSLENSRPSSPDSNRKEFLMIIRNEIILFFSIILFFLNLY